MSEEYLHSCPHQTAGVCIECYNQLRAQLAESQEQVEMLREAIEQADVRSGMLKIREALAATQPKENESMNAMPETSKFAALEVKKGETFIGAIIKADGTGHHIILLPGDIVKPSWDDSMEWAKSLGGDLPDRAEQAMMFKHFKAKFKKDWYWSNTLDAEDPGYVWAQGFRCGNQHSYSLSGQCRSRAVRRLPI